MKNRFGQKTYKVVVQAGTTCPTRDGSLGKGGCSFCDVRGSSSFFGKKGRAASVGDQLRKSMVQIQQRFGAQAFLAYFQSYSNTYADCQKLRSLYSSALEIPGVVGLCIGTRPDCLGEPILELLEEFGQKTYVSLECGVQSFEDKTLNWFSRGHDSQCSQDAIEKLARLAPSVSVSAHLIFGAPTESKNAAREAAQILGKLKIEGVKLHQLMVLKSSELGKRYEKEPFPVLSLQEYAQKVAEFINHLKPSVFIERLYATATHPEECLAPQWSKERWQTHNLLRDYLAQSGCKQGSLFSIDR